eukprot:415617-Rhodomonas_salina.1
MRRTSRWSIAAPRCTVSQLLKNPEPRTHMSLGRIWSTVTVSWGSSRRKVRWSSTVGSSGSSGTCVAS